MLSVHFYDYLTDGDGVMTLLALLDPLLGQTKVVLFGSCNLYNFLGRDICNNKQFHEALGTWLHGRLLSVSNQIL